MCERRKGAELMGLEYTHRAGSIANALMPVHSIVASIRWARSRAHIVLVGETRSAYLRQQASTKTTLQRRRNAGDEDHSPASHATRRSDGQGQPLSPEMSTGAVVWPALAGRTSQSPAINGSGHPGPTQ